jgi:hypothetical protein
MEQFEVSHFGLSSPADLANFEIHQARTQHRLMEGLVSDLRLAVTDRRQRGDDAGLLVDGGESVQRLGLAAAEGLPELHANQRTQNKAMMLASSPDWDKQRRR